MQSESLAKQPGIFLEQSRSKIAGLWSRFPLLLRSPALGVGALRGIRYNRG